MDNIFARMFPRWRFVPQPSELDLKEYAVVVDARKAVFAARNAKTDRNVKRWLTFLCKLAGRRPRARSCKQVEDPDISWMVDETQLVMKLLAPEVLAVRMGTRLKRWFCEVKTMSARQRYAYEAVDARGATELERRLQLLVSPVADLRRAVQNAGGGDTQKMTKRDAIDRILRAENPRAYDGEPGVDADAGVGGLIVAAATGASGGGALVGGSGFGGSVGAVAGAAAGGDDGEAPPDFDGVRRTTLSGMKVPQLRSVLQGLLGQPGRLKKAGLVSAILEAEQLQAREGVGAADAVVSAVLEAGQLQAIGGAGAADAVVSAILGAEQLQASEGARAADAEMQAEEASGAAPSVVSGVKRKPTHPPPNKEDP